MATKRMKWLLKLSREFSRFFSFPLEIVPVYFILFNRREWICDVDVYYMCCSADFNRPIYTINRLKVLDTLVDQDFFFDWLKATNIAFDFRPILVFCQKILSFLIDHILIDRLTWPKLSRTNFNWATNVTKIIANKF